MKLKERILNLFRKEGDVSDGYHTFDELYEYRTVYNAALFNELAKIPGNPYDVHFSFRHYTGEPCFGGGWFVVMAQLPTGQVSNHYRHKYLELFSSVEYRPIAAEWDGHTPQDALKRLWCFCCLSRKKE